MRSHVEQSKSIGKALYRIWSGPIWAQYLIGLGGPLFVGMVRASLQPYLQERFLFMLFTVPIALAAFFGGLWPGIVATMLSFVIGMFWLVPNAQQNASNMPPYDIQLQSALILVCIWIFICVVCDLMRKAAFDLERASKERDETRADLEQVLDRISDAYFTVDRRGNLTHVNQAFLDLIGEEWSSEHGISIDRLVEVSAGPLDWSVVKDLATAQRPIATDVKQPSGDRWFQLRAFPDYGETSIFVLDVTSRKQVELNRERILAEERKLRSNAEEANRLKDEFVATTSHELRTPLSTILGWTEILLRRNQQDDLKEGLAAIDRSTRLQVQLIDDLLDMSRIATGKMKLNMQLVEVHELLTDVVRANTPEATKKGVTIVFEPSNDEYVLRADPERLSQIFSNIISNAIKFTPAEGKIMVDVRVEDDRQVSISITDTGEGIDAPLLDSIFQRFRQANASLSRKHGGLGLGLAIARELVELHGGRIEADSPGKGKGSTFRVTLQAVQLETEFNRKDSRSMPVESLFDASILIVEDDEGTRTVLQMILLEAGANVKAVPSAAEGLQWLGKHTPNVLISDIGMPEMDGYQFMRRVRTTLGPAAPKHALALTAFATADDRRKAIEAGFDDYLAKPVDSRQLVSTIASLLAKDLQNEAQARN